MVKAVAYLAMICGTAPLFVVVREQAWWEVVEYRVVCVCSPCLPLTLQFSALTFGMVPRTNTLVAQLVAS